MSRSYRRLRLLEDGLDTVEQRGPLTVEKGLEIRLERAAGRLLEPGAVTVEDAVQVAGALAPLVGAVDPELPVAGELTPVETPALSSTVCSSSV